MATYISRTLGTPTDNKKWTFSAWFKITDQSASDRGIFNIGGNSSEYTRLNVAGSQQLEYDNKISPSAWDGRRYATAKRRDPGAWYHVVAVFDSDNGTPADRMITYFNGTRITDYTNSIDPSSGAVSGNTSGETIRIGVVESTAYFNGVMSWVQFVDGLALAPTEFGEVDSTSGIWKIKTDVYGTPGNNGFCLKMEDRTNLDLDSSSNAHTFTTTGTGTATYDNPSNNFATLNPLAKDIAATYAISNGNTTVQSSSGWWTMPLTLGVGGGKWYFEAKMDNLSNYAHVGWATADQLSQGGVDSYFGAVSVNESACGYGQDGSIYYSTTTSNASDTAYGNTYTTGDVIGCALDLDNGFAYWSKNGTWQNSGVPTSGATGTGAFTIDNPSSKGYLWLPGVAIYSATWSVNAGNGYFGTTLISSPEADDGGVGAFAYDVPEGYRAVCTKNIKAYGG